MKSCLLLSITAVLLGLLISMSPVSAMQAEQDFQYSYPYKGYDIKYYDVGCKGNYDFAEWVCRKKQLTISTGNLNSV
jgi:hypothetical protein